MIKLSKTSVSVPDKKYQEPGLPEFNCTLDKLGPFYPGQTIELHFITIIVPLYMETQLIRIEDGPESACSTKNRSVMTLLRFKCLHKNHIHGTT